MKRLIIILVAVVLLAGVTFAQNKIPDEWTWKLRALFAELNLAQQRLNDARDAAQEFLKELDAKGYVVKDGMIMEKPKPKAPKEEPKK